MADANMVEAAPADMQRDVQVRLRPLRCIAPTFGILTRTRGFSSRRMRPVGTHLHAAVLPRAIPSKWKAGSMPSLRRSNRMTWTPMVAMLPDQLA